MLSILSFTDSLNLVATDEGVSGSKSPPRVAVPQALARQAVLYS